MNATAYEAALDACRELLSGSEFMAHNAARLALDLSAASASEWRILIQMKPEGPFDPRWTDCGEGPWDDFTAAQMWAFENIECPHLLVATAYELSDT